MSKRIIRLSKSTLRSIIREEILREAKVDPTQVPGANLVSSTSEFNVYMPETPEALLALSRDAGWFRDMKFAKMYFDMAPIAIVFGSQETKRFRQKYGKSALYIRQIGGPGENDKIYGRNDVPVHDQETRQLVIDLTQDALDDALENFEAQSPEDAGPGKTQPGWEDGGFFFDRKSGR